METIISIMGSVGLSSLIYVPQMRKHFFEYRKGLKLQ